MYRIIMILGIIFSLFNCNENIRINNINKIDTIDLIKKDLQINDNIEVLFYQDTLYFDTSRYVEYVFIDYSKNCKYEKDYYEFYDTERNLRNSFLKKEDSLILKDPLLKNSDSIKVLLNEKYKDYLGFWVKLFKNKDKYYRYDSDENNYYFLTDSLFYVQNYSESIFFYKILSIKDSSNVIRFELQGLNAFKYRKSIELFKTFNNTIIFKENNYPKEGSNTLGFHFYLGLKLEDRFKYPLIVHIYSELPFASVFEDIDYENIIKKN